LRKKGKKRQKTEMTGINPRHRLRKLETCRSLRITVSKWNHQDCGMVEGPQRGGGGRDTTEKWRSGGVSRNGHRTQKSSTVLLKKKDGSNTYEEREKITPSKIRTEQKKGSGKEGSGGKPPGEITSTPWIKIQTLPKMPV